MRAVCAGRCVEGRASGWHRNVSGGIARDLSDAVTVQYDMVAAHLFELCCINQG